MEFSNAQLRDLLENVRAQEDACAVLGDSLEQALEAQEAGDEVRLRRALERVVLSVAAASASMAETTASIRRIVPADHPDLDPGGSS